MGLSVMIVRKKFYVLNKKRLQKGINVSLPGVCGKMGSEQRKGILEEVAYYVQRKR